jgi:transposase
MGQWGRYIKERAQTGRSSKNPGRDLVDSCDRFGLEPTARTLREMEQRLPLPPQMGEARHFRPIVGNDRRSGGESRARRVHLKAHQDACRYPGDPAERALGKTKGGRNSKLNACVNGKGKALRLMLAPGNRHDILFAIEVLGEVKGKIVLGDRGYDGDELRANITERGGVALIPPKANRTNRVFYIPEIGRRRRVVENFFCRIKRHRRVATRYDRLTETFLSFVSLAAIADWVRF